MRALNGRGRAAAAFAFALVAAWLPWSRATAAERLHCTVVSDAETGTVIHREGVCDRRFFPMSTFKVPLALMGYDAGILTDEHNPAWPKPADKQNARGPAVVDPTIWEKQSIVWYSQELTRRLGEKRFAGYVNALDYGNKDVSGDPGKSNGLTDAWLMSSLAISPDEQVRLLRRLLKRELPVSAQAISKTMAIIPRFPAGDWAVHGKTGSGWLKTTAGATDKNRPLGWFVGWAEKAGRRIVFARVEVGMQPQSKPMSFLVRDSLLKDLPALLEGH
ncbi:class D beta-lactamase [Rhodoligotrophos defluvii]|uniref:class D beta-lactamase n=1 Tax=Rhodoligotrophos defluvii TaxID=2561934 RepID=UPI0010C9B500|nr:class D beta-lactamase [Rhodoligotrophos defluvii]